MSLLEELKQQRDEARASLELQEELVRAHETNVTDWLVRIAALDIAIDALSQKPVPAPAPIPHAPDGGEGHALNEANPYERGTLQSALWQKVHHPQSANELPDGTGVEISEGFVKWKGGEWDGDPETQVIVINRAGFTNGSPRPASSFSREWSSDGANGIVAYRLLPPPEPTPPEAPVYAPEHEEGVS